MDHPMPEQEKRYIPNKFLDEIPRRSTYLVYQYVVNLLDSSDPKSPFAYRICSAAEKNLSLASQDIDFPKGRQKTAASQKTKNVETVYPEDRKGPAIAANPDDWETLNAYFRKKLAETPEGEIEPFHENLLRLSDYLGLDDLGKAVVEFCYAIYDNPWCLDFLNHATSHVVNNIPPAMARMLGQPDRALDVARLISPSGPLVSCGLLNEDVESIFFAPDDSLYGKMSDAVLPQEEIVGHLLGTPLKSELNIGDFEHLGDDLAFLTTFIKSAVEGGETGINILIYGPPGGGKTELATVLADHLGYALYSVAEGGDRQDTAESRQFSGEMGETTIVMPKGKEDEGARRKTALLRAQALLKGNRKALLLFDEAEDLLLKGQDSDKKADTDSKIELNRLLERNPVVTLWTANDPDKFHAAVRQRYAFSMEMGYPPTLVRERIWKRQMEMKGISLPDADTRELARRFDAPPRMVSKATRAVKFSGGGIDTIKRSLFADAQIVFGHREEILTGPRVPKHFNRNITALSQNDAALIDHLIEKGRSGTPFALYASGKKGSGLASLMRYIGEGLVQNVIEGRLANISKPGQITDIFTAAADHRLFLVLHGLEDLSPNPKSASGFHDNPLVNEFIQAARNHEHPFAVTGFGKTDFPSALMSLFSHRISIKTLSRDQARKAWEIYIQSDPPDTLDRLADLVPSDFSNVGKLLVRMDTQTPEQVIGLLEREKSIRGVNAPSMGAFP